MKFLEVRTQSSTKPFAEFPVKGSIDNNTSSDDIEQWILWFLSCQNWTNGNQKFPKNAVRFDFFFRKIHNNKLDFLAEFSIEDTQL